MSFTDAEIKAMHFIVKAMETLDEDQQLRIAIYMVDRYAPNILSSTNVNQSTSPLPSPLPRGEAPKAL